MSIISDVIFSKKGKAPSEEGAVHFLIADHTPIS